MTPSRKACHVVDTLTAAVVRMTGITIARRRFFEQVYSPLFRQPQIENQTTRIHDGFQKFLGQSECLRLPPRPTAAPRISFLAIVIRVENPGSADHRIRISP